MFGWFRRRRKDIDLVVCSAGHRWNARDRKIGGPCAAQYRRIKGNGRGGIVEYPYRCRERIIGKATQ